MTARRSVKLLAWLCLAAIVVLSLVTPSLRPVTALPHNLEHAGIFLAAGLAVGLGYPGHWWRNALLLTAFAGAIEIAQLYAPGRHARWMDFFVDATAACLGAALASMVERMTLSRGG